MKRLPKALPKPTTRIIDWFHLAMKIQPMQQIADHIVGSRPILCGILAVIGEEIKALKWKLWHGQVERAICTLEKIIVNMDELGHKGDFPAARLNSLRQQLLTYTILRKRRKSTVYLAALPGHLSNHVHRPRAPVSARFGRNPGLEVERSLTGARWLPFMPRRRCRFRPLAPEESAHCRRRSLAPATDIRNIQRLAVARSQRPGRSFRPAPGQSRGPAPKGQQMAG
jgi:hypothetical protein